VWAETVRRLSATRGSVVCEMFSFEAPLHIRSRAVNATPSEFAGQDAGAARDVPSVCCTYIRNLDAPLHIRGST
jgi:hypothetical protein